MASYDELRERFLDQYVKIISTDPKHCRFVGETGKVHAVNYNGYLLVQFGEDDTRWGNNTGWFEFLPTDIEKTVRPDPPPPPPKPAKKPVKKVVAKKEVSEKTSEKQDAEKGEEGTGEGSLETSSQVAKPEKKQED
ncbi:MAG: hypothetical protein MPJ24_01970 [Pirellulaceae bacterium]|nr:hypothetical protein [Pirellulaceae bacterium]